MLLPIAAIIAGLILLVWSADRFVDGSAATARYFGMPSLLIGIIIVGFGTSAPEMVVSALAATAGNPGIALGNAYGSNITNIGLILGFTALISPIAVSSQVVRKELPILLAISAMAAWQIYDGELTRLDAIILLAVFALIMGTTIYQELKKKNHAPQDARAMAAWQIYDGELTRLDAIILLAVFALIMGTTIYQELKKKNHAPQDAQDTQDAQESSMSLPKAIMWLVLGLVLLIVSSRMLVWGAVEIAHALGISDLIIGLTIVAVGTSLPELASSIIAAIKNEHDIALGNIIGSNLFNTLAVVGIAGSIAPMEVSFEVLTRDVTVMCALTVALLIFALGKKGKARINRFEGALLLLSYIAYTVYLISTAFTVMCALTVALLIFALGKKGKARINRFEGALLLLSYIAYTVYLISTAFFATSH